MLLDTEFELSVVCVWSQNTLWFYDLLSHWKTLPSSITTEIIVRCWLFLHESHWNSNHDFYHGWTEEMLSRTVSWYLSGQKRKRRKKILKVWDRGRSAVGSKPTLSHIFFTAVLLRSYATPRVVQNPGISQCSSSVRSFSTLTKEASD